MHLLKIARLCVALALAAAAPFANASDGKPLREHEYVKIGGIEQWVTIDGENCANPVVLFVHGGPGNPLSPFMDELYGSWKTQFTLATWDQRLSGRTYSRNDPKMILRANSSRRTGSKSPNTCAAVSARSSSTSDSPAMASRRKSTCRHWERRTHCPCSSSRARKTC
jgi:hypothetical protein